MAWEGLAGLVDRWRRREAMQGDVSAIASEAALVAPPYVRALAVHEQTTRWVSACALCVGVGLAADNAAALVVCGDRTLASADAPAPPIGPAGLWGAPSSGWVGAVGGLHRHTTHC